MTGPTGTWERRCKELWQLLKLHAVKHALLREVEEYFAERDLPLDDPFAYVLKECEVLRTDNDSLRSDRDKEIERSRTSKKEMDSLRNEKLAWMQLVERARGAAETKDKELERLRRQLESLRNEELNWKKEAETKDKELEQLRTREEKLEKDLDSFQNTGMKLKEEMGAASAAAESKDAARHETNSQLYEQSKATAHDFKQEGETHERDFKQEGETHDQSTQEKDERTNQSEGIVATSQDHVNITNDVANWGATSSDNPEPFAEGTIKSPPPTLSDTDSKSPDSDPETFEEESESAEIHSEASEGDSKVTNLIKYLFFLLRKIKRKEVSDRLKDIHSVASEDNLVYAWILQYVECNKAYFEGLVKKQHYPDPVEHKQWVFFMKTEGAKDIQKLLKQWYAEERASTGLLEDKTSHDGGEENEAESKDSLEE